MAASSLKRKWANDSLPRKVRKLSAEPEEVREDSRDEMDEHDAESVPDDEEEAQEWTGIGGEASPVAASGKPNKPPTGEELRLIMDASDLFRSNTFKLQIDALLPNVRPKPSRIPPLERFLMSLHTLLTSLAAVTPVHPLEASRKLLKKGVSVPYSLPLPSEETNWKVAFQKPSEINVVGSWANKLSVKGNDGYRFGVDLALEMPAGLFQEKDYLNGRFFQKRAFYLATLAAALIDPKAELGIEVSYQSLHDDPRLTKLILTSAPDAKNGLKKLNAEVCIVPVLPQNSPIPLHRLSPAQSNLRISSSSETDENESRPSPLYNTALLTTLVPKAQLLAAHALKQNTLAFSDALTLLRVWANQRGFGDGSRLCARGFDGKGPWWSAVLELLINGEYSFDAKAKGKGKRKPLGKGLSSYQLFRAALDFLSKHDFEKDAVFMKSPDGHKFSADLYNKDGPIFVDPSSVNLLAGVPIGSLKLLQYDAKRTLTELDGGSISSDPFAPVFLSDRRDIPTRFDAILYVDLSASKLRKTSTHDVLDQGSLANVLLSSLSSVLHQGLGNRVKAVVLLHPSTLPRPLSQAHPSAPNVIHIGLIYDSAHAFRQVDHGPAVTEVESPEGQRFRDLWGDKAELRRFKDGKISESVVWDVKTADEKAHIPTMIVRHLLSRHFAVEGPAIQTWQEPFDALVRLPELVSKMYMESGVSIGFRGAMSAYDSLVKDIKAQDQLFPLALLAVSSASECLRYTSVFAPLPLDSSILPILPPNARYLHPIEFIIEFEKSSQWPDDLAAIQKVKLAFFERIASAMMTNINGLTASVVVGEAPQVSEIQDQARLEIVTSQGWAFSARIHNEREAILLDRIIDNKVNRLPHVVTKHQDTKKDREYYSALKAKEVYLRRFIHAPQHHRVIAKLCHHFSAFPPTVRLVKRWFASHWLLHGQVSEEAIELLCARFFVWEGWEQALEDGKSPEVSGVPDSRERGFASVMEFLKEWRWEEGLSVPLYSTDPSNSLSQTKQKSPHSGVWAISTMLDKEGYMWTGNGPDAIVARRISVIATATWDFLQGMERGRLSVQPMFTHPTADYDFLIHLDPAVLPRYFQNASVDTSQLARRGKYSNLPATAETVRPGFDPARALFLDLQRVYQDTCKLFYDPLGGDCIGGIWYPVLLQRKPFKVLGGYSTVPCSQQGKGQDKQKGMVELNKTSILSEIERMGKGLVKSITVQEK
ncbi:Nrap protein [Mycena floridula]|nr:Nrap protein [Mycena floridula]